MEQSFDRIIFSGLWAVLACAQKEELQEQFAVERLGGQIMISYLSSNKKHCERNYGFRRRLLYPVIWFGLVDLVW